MASHETTHHDDHHHHTNNEDSARRMSYGASFWFVAIVAGLFIAALNFISVMGDDHGGGHNAGHGDHAPATREASANQTLHGETGAGRVEADTTQHFDTVRHDARATEGNQ